MDHPEHASRVFPQGSDDTGNAQGPQERQEYQTPAENGSSPYGGSPRHRTILVVENEATNRHLMEQILRFAGYTTQTATNGREALELLQTMRADLILVDIWMPVLDGFQLLALLREQPAYAATPIVAVTAHAMQEDRQRALRSGFTEYLTKPFRPRDLLRMVEQVLARD